MENKQDKVTIKEELLDKVSGGEENPVSGPGPRVVEACKSEIPAPGGGDDQKLRIKW